MSLYSRENLLKFFVSIFIWRPELFIMQLITYWALCKVGTAFLELIAQGWTERYLLRNILKNSVEAKGKRQSLLS